MFIGLTRIVFLVLGIITSCSAATVCEVRDDTGQILKLTSSAKRLVVLAPDLVENVYAIGAGDRIIGVVKGSDYPAAALQIPLVGSYAGIDLERIAALKPDIVIAWKYGFIRQLAAIKKLGIPVYIAAPKQLEDIPHLQRQLGCLTNLSASAEKSASQFEREIKQLRDTQHVAHAPKVFFQIDTYALITINKDSWINQVITLCGGNNVYANLKTIAPEINRESLIMMNPDIIFNVSDKDDWKKSWSAWQEVSAVKRNHLITITPDLISRAGPRLAAGARQVCQGIIGG